MGSLKGKGRRAAKMPDFHSTMDPRGSSMDMPGPGGRFAELEMAPTHPGMLVAARPPQKTHGRNRPRQGRGGRRQVGPKML